MAEGAPAGDPMEVKKESKKDLGSPDHCRPSRQTLGHLQKATEAQETKIHARTEPHGPVRFENRVHDLYVIL